MKQSLNDKILAKCGNGEFIGRNDELDRLLRHASGEGPNGLVLLHAPSAGASELLRQTYDRLFIGDGVIPFYFEIRSSDGSLRSTALRFVREFLTQAVAFRRRNKRILDSSPELFELAQLAIPSDGYWIDRLIETLDGESTLDDDRSFVRNCLSAPLRANGHGAKSFVMIDGLHVAARMTGGETFVEDLSDVFGRSAIPFVFAGLRRFLFARTPFESVTLEKLSSVEAGNLVENQAARFGVAINEQTRDLITAQLDQGAAHIASLLLSAAEKNASLDSFERVEQMYTDEIFGGRIGRYFDAAFDRACPDPELQERIITLLAESLKYDGGRVPSAYWKRHTELNTAALDPILDAMNIEEIVNLDAGVVRFDAGNTVLGDYVAGRARLVAGDDTRALVVGETLAANIKRAPVLMARLYRRLAAMGLRDLMQAFDGRHISTAMIDYGRFNAELKGADDERIEKAFKEDNEKTALPRIVYTAHAVTFYPRLAELADAERSAIAFGFNTEAEKEDIVWIAAEIDSKLEATRDLAEFWCDRLEMVAAHCEFHRFQLWLVAPEGFAPDALDVLKERRAFGSSRKQAAMLAALLNTDISPAAASAADEYEIVVPMGDDTEMIAARAVEDIAKRRGIAAKTINQVKTALVEACINATEHSLSPDRRINVKFVVDTEKFVITVANRGVQLMPEQEAAVTRSDAQQPDEKITARRGWGLKLMKGLMDEVTIEETDDGTRITMVKYLSATSQKT